MKPYETRKCTMKDAFDWVSNYIFDRNSEESEWFVYDDEEDTGEEREIDEYEKNYFTINYFEIPKIKLEVCKGEYYKSEIPGNEPAVQICYYLHEVGAYEDVFIAQVDTLEEIKALISEQKNISIDELMHMEAVIYE
ncbi:hypothetical protein SAMN02910276_01819 [Butyrivibrio sp. Su6]|uniref:hypothetical protein n=1 Tax=Butyrivibrio sp. Su6 TaxID=1520810 RepID=UPI00089F82D4|nr:hypothetical protein [Butyrivibrio sp. Su6]SEG08792.1 hypothetical protein SAMN02910276_01819 [Butyrivibrio sp. Su6]